MNRIINMALTWISYGLTICLITSVSMLAWSSSSTSSASATAAPSNTAAKTSKAAPADKVKFEKALLGYFKGPLKVTRTTGTQVDNWVRNDAWIFVYTAEGYPGWYELDIYNQSQILTDSYIFVNETTVDTATNTYTFIDGDAKKWETRYTIRMDGDKMELNGDLVLGPSIFTFQGNLVRVKSAPF